MAVTLVEITAYDPVAAAAVTVRVCNADDHRVTRLNGVRWWPVLGRAPQRRIDLFDGDFSGQIGIGIGDLEIATRAGVSVLANAPRYSWGERAVTIWRGPLGGAWGDYVQVFKGLTRPARGSNGRLTIGLRPDDRWLDKPLLPTFAGTGSAEGPAELKGVAKPLALGAPQFVPGVVINRALNIWQISAFAINGITAVLDRLARFGGPAFAGNDATYAALASATIPAGSWRSCTALGLVRFGAPPAVPSFIINGDNGGIGGWVRRPGAVIRRVAEIAGAAAGQVDATSLAALDSWAATLPSGGNISLYLGEQTTARDVIQQIAASCNAGFGVGWDGRLFVARATIGTATATLAADGSRTPAVADVQLLETSAPFWRHAMAAEPTWRVHSEGEYGVIGVADQITYPDGTAVSALQPAAAGADPTRATVPAMPRGEWSSASVSYVTGDIVFRNNAAHTAKANHTSTSGNGPPSAQWEPLTPGPDQSFASANFNQTISNTSYGTTPVASLTVKTKTVGSVALNANLEVQGGIFNADQVQGAGKWQRWNGSSWLDVGSASTTGLIDPGNQQSLTIAATASSLAAATSYDFRLLMLVSPVISGDTCVAGGTVTGQGS